MSVSTNDRRTTINASNGQTSLSGDFILYDQSQLVVTRTRSSVDTTLVLTTDYTVSGTGVAGGFTVTLVSAAQTGDVYILEGDRPVTSDAAFSTGGDFTATEVNGRLDRAAVERQELRRDVDDLIAVVGDLEGGEALITGTMTAGYIPLANDTSTVTDSIMTQLSGTVIQATATLPVFSWKSTLGGTNEKTWISIVNATQWVLGTFTDSNSTGAPAITITRSGTAIASLALTGTNIGLTGITTITGATTITGNTGVTGTLASTGNLSTSAGVIIARSTTLTHATSGAVLLDALDQTGIMANGVPQYDGANVVWSLVGTGSIDTTGAVEGDVLYFDGANVAWGVITGFSGDDGSAANPTYGFVNEASPNGMGMYRSAADTLGFATNGVERVTIGNSVVAFSTAVSIPYNASGRLGLYDSDSSHQLFIVPGSNLTADRVLTITTGDAARTLTMSGNATISGTNTGDQTITLTGDATGSGTGSFAVTLATVTVAKGGTGITSGTSGGIPYFSASTTIASSAALGATEVVLGGGAGAAPTSSSALVYTSGILITTDATTAGFGWNDSDGGADAKKWFALANANDWALGTYTDAGAGGSAAITITRSGTTISTIALAATNISTTGVLAQTGAATFSSTVGVTGISTLTGGVKIGNATALSFTTSGASLNTQAFANTDTSGVFSNIYSLHTTGTGGVVNAFLKGRGTLASPTVVASGDVIGSLLFYGFDGTDYEAAARIRVVVDGTPGSNDMPGRIEFLTTPDGSATPTVQLTISSTGYITQRADVDMTNIFGRVRIDSRVSDAAYFSHYDMSAAGQQALVQSALGATTLNSASGQGLAFSIAGTATAACDSSGNWQFGPASTNTITMTGRFFCRQVTDAGPMTATGGTIGEIVFNTSNNKWYGCTVSHASAATWSAFN